MKLFSSFGILASAASGGGEPPGPQLDAPEIYTYDHIGSSISISISNPEGSTIYEVQRRSLSSINGTPSAWETVYEGTSNGYADTLPSQWVRYDYRAIVKADGFADSGPSNVVAAFWLPTDDMASLLAAGSYFEDSSSAIFCRKVIDANWPEVTHTYQVGEREVNGAFNFTTATTAESPTPPVGFVVYASNSHSLYASYIVVARRLLPDGQGGFASSNRATYEFTYYPPE